MAYPKTPVDVRFHSKYETEPNTGCWLWSDALDVYGYGRLQIDGKARKAHQVSYELNYGPIPRGKIICHTCDVRCCVNPEHIFLGTWEENVRDMMSKGRNRPGGKPHPGEMNGRAILNEEYVRGLLARKKNGETISTRAEAEKMGVAIYAIQNILTGKAWKHVER